MASMLCVYRALDSLGQLRDERDARQQLEYCKSLQLCRAWPWLTVEPRLD